MCESGGYVMKYYDLHCPIKMKSVSHKDLIKPWIDLETTKEGLELEIVFTRD